MDVSLPQVKQFQGIVLYNGPSLIDGEHIVAIATGFGRSRNRKVGKAIQVWILVADKNPAQALREGSDKSICGNCKHRHFRSCYVNIAHGPGHIYKAWQRDVYHELTDYSVFSGRFVRFGAYGDPAAVPTYIWQNIASVCDGWTGYTHRWKQCDNELKHYCMASCDTQKESIDARSRGWRPFYVRQDGDDIPDGFFVCPASNEAGKRLTCSQCRACQGGEYRGQGSPTIIAHGPSWKQVYFHRGMKAFQAKKRYAGIGWEWGAELHNAQRMREKTS